MTVDKKITLVPVILCGGSGTRLWPLSRQDYPKQFLKLTGEHSLFQQTLLRLISLKNHINIDLKSPIIVANEAHRFLVLDQLHNISHCADIILEPSAKNTAPSLTLAALHAEEKYENAVLVVLPADHTIGSEEEFSEVLMRAATAVISQNISIATLGVTPTYPETGYGYIQCRTDGLSVDFKPVINFFEKPDMVLAQQYFEQKCFYWNSGIFIMTSNTWLQSIKTFASEISTTVQSAWDGKTLDNPFIRPNSDAFESVPSDSIDYAVIEHCMDGGYKLGMFELTTAWSDLGTWQSVRDYYKSNKNHNTDQLHQSPQADVDNNVTVGDVILKSVQNCYVNGDKRLVCLIGTEDLIVIDTDDAILIAHQSQSQAVKMVVDELSQSNRKEISKHRKVYRPWGWYDSIDEADRFKVKRICVNPKASLSLQKHHHRTEHWVVVKGTAEVTCGDKTILLSENQSTYIPLGVVHRLSNPGSIPLEIIEIQSGSYLEEDDIVRLEDDYGRE